ncbi:MAG: DUF882 domain-containing protein, partial [Pseudomonadota bacterium]|nr:DUF882 domain-containing protein [Pseudomonadota bacterium]
RQSLKEISWALRDHRTDEVMAIDPRLIDLMHALQVKMGRKPLDVLSGYRSQETNVMLRQHSRRVAKNSFHTKGRAVDLCIPGCDLTDLCQAARELNGGGVGYYPRSGFVHIDTGPVRYWR